MNRRFLSLSFLFYLLLVLLAIAGYYFSISQGLFYWFFPDELMASKLYSTYGLLGCAKNYYLHTTINRIAAGFGVCGMAYTAHLFGALFLGWVVARLLFYALLPVSVAYLLKEICSIPLKWSLIIALLLSAMTLYLISFEKYYMFGLDLAIYAMATVSFFALVALLPKSLMHTRYFVLFSIIFAINLNSHEVFLVITGFFIPLFAWYSFLMSKPAYVHKWQRGALFLKSLCKNKQVWILLTIYIISALATLLAPGVKMRQSIWPSTGTFSDGFNYSVLAVEEMLYMLYQARWFLSMTFLLGVLTTLSLKSKEEPRYTLLSGFLFLTPLLYLFITGFLVGLTPSLWSGSSRTTAFRWLGELLHNKDLMNQGGFVIRQMLFLYLGWFLDFFLLGFFIVEKIKGIFQLQLNRWSLQLALFVSVMMLFLLHSEGTGSIRVLSALFERKMDARFDSLKPTNSFAAGDVLHYLFPSVSTINPIERKVFFKRNRIIDHKLSLINIRTSGYLYSQSGKAVAYDTLSYVYDPMIHEYQILKDAWLKTICDFYKVSIIGKN